MGLFVQLHNFVSSITVIRLTFYSRLQILVSKYCYRGEIDKIKVISVMFLDRSCFDKRDSIIADDIKL
jgi:hypothetical protein